MSISKVKYKVGVYVSWRKRLLLIREISEGHREYRWNIVKGTVEEKDGSFLNTAQRECLEEVGLHVKPFGILNISYRHRKQNPVTQINILAVSTSARAKLASKQKQRRLHEDIIAAEFFSPAALVKFSRRELMNERVYRGIRRWIRKTKTLK